jgi:1-acyl-sn-glycerol-3-phosphate acyltransferase
MIRGLLAIVVVTPYALLAGLLGYPLARLLRNPGLLHVLGRFGCRVLIALGGVRLVVDAQPGFGDLRNTVVMANHQSLLDIPAVFLGVPADLRAVTKTELYRFPFLGRCFRLAGFVEVDRRNKVQARQALARAVDALRAGETFLIFPEGTRTRDGSLAEFKKGGFLLAMEAGARILPVAIEGAYALLRPDSWRLRSGVLRVRALAPIDTREFGPERRDELVDLVRTRLAAALSEAAAGGVAPTPVVHVQGGPDLGGRRGLA